MNTEEINDKNNNHPTVRETIPLTNQQMWKMAKIITEKQKAARDHPTDLIDWNLLEGFWFEWLEEELCVGEI